MTLKSGCTWVSAAQGQLLISTLLICVNSWIYSRLIRQSVSFYWCLGLHCVVKLNSYFQRPITHSSNNKSNKHSKWPVFSSLSFFHFWMQTLWFRIIHRSSLVLYTKLPYDPNNPFLTKHERILPLRSSVASLPLFCFFVFLFVMPELHSGTRQHGEVVRKNCTALHCSAWCSWHYSPAVKKKKSDTVDVLCPERVGDKEKAIRMMLNSFRM